VILNLISGPRNVSTALMYSFAQRSDTTVLDEPFYGVFLAKTGVRHPGYKDVLAALPHEEKVVTTRLAAHAGTPVLFVKNMAHHMEVLEEPFISGAENIFLIRDPKQILSSYTAVITNPIMRDIGIAYQYSLFCQLQEQGKQPIVIDAASLLDNPVSVLTRVCTLCGLDFDQRMVHWPKGPKAYDGVWAPYWYATAHNTTGFQVQPPRRQTLPQHLYSLYTEAKSIYEKLVPFSVKA
jgi:hypothetical protein